jgi:hypothetical protein
MQHFVAAFEAYDVAIKIQPQTPALQAALQKYALAISVSFTPNLFPQSFGITFCAAQENKRCCNANRQNVIPHLSLYFGVS